MQIITFPKLMLCIDVNTYTYMHVLMHVGWGRVENGCVINFLCAMINFSVLSLCEEEVEETEIQSMAADQQTYHCSNVIGNRIIQVSQFSLTPFCSTPPSLSLSLLSHAPLTLSLSFSLSLPLPPSLLLSLSVPPPSLIISLSPSLSHYLSFSNLMLLCSFLCR